MEHEAQGSTTDQFHVNFLYMQLVVALDDILQGVLEGNSGAFVFMKAQGLVSELDIYARDGILPSTELAGEFKDYLGHVENAPDIDDIFRRYLGFEDSSEFRDIEHQKKLIEMLERFRATGKPN
jgi:hypothetical protein